MTDRAPTPRPYDRQEAGILAAAVLGTAGLAWLYLTTMGTVGGAALAPWRRGALGALPLAFAMWAVMMAAMMLPPSLPWVVTFARLSSGTALGRRGRTAAFLAGYATVWGAYALAAASVQIVLQHTGTLVAPGPALPARVGGLVLVGAGAFQVLPLKAACLSQCRSPVSFFLAAWRDGPGGAFSMGVGHGTHCLGCCWALMAAAFALGVMNLAWMATLTLVLCIEKLVPRGAELGRLAGALAVLLGAWMMLAGW